MTRRDERRGRAHPGKKPTTRRDRRARAGRAESAPRSPAAGERIRHRLTRHDWPELARELDAWGYARVPGLLTAGECAELAALWDRHARFRSSVDMERHRFGAGAYRYFARPLPALVQALRTQLYARLAPLANRWQERLGAPERFPPRLGAFLERCAAAGQARPTPLLLRYTAGGYNCLHQDRYGALAFPLQATVLLSRPEADFRGGEFLLTEQRPRMQSRGFAVPLARGEAVLFANAERPVRGARGDYRVQVRHGVSRLLAGRRLALGIIFHDAR